MYQAIGYDKKAGIMHVWDDELGHRKFPFQAYGYLPNPNGTYQALDGTRLNQVSGNHRDNPKSYETPPHAPAHMKFPDESNLDIKTSSNPVDVRK